MIEIITSLSIACVSCVSSLPDNSINYVKPNNNVNILVAGANDNVISIKLKPNLTPSYNLNNNKKSITPINNSAKNLRKKTKKLKELIIKKRADNPKIDLRDSSSKKNNLLKKIPVVNTLQTPINDTSKFKKTTPKTTLPKVKKTKKFIHPFIKNKKSARKALLKLPPVKSAVIPKVTLPPSVSNTNSTNNAEKVTPKITLPPIKKIVNEKTIRPIPKQNKDFSLKLPPVVTTTDNLNKTEELTPSPAKKTFVQPQAPNINTGLNFLLKLPPTASPLAKPADTKESQIALPNFVLPPVNSIVQQALTNYAISEIDFVSEGELELDELQSIAARYSTNSSISASQIEILRNEITKYYIEKGFINSGALVNNPPVVDGKLTYEIVFGKLTEFSITGLEGLRESYISERLWADKDKSLNLNEMQSNFQLLLTNPLFNKIVSNLRPGKKRGEAVLNLAVERARPWGISTYINNYRSPSSDEYQLGVSGYLHNITSLGDWVNASASSSGNSNSYSLSFFIPTPKIKTIWGISYDVGNTLVTEEPFDTLNFSNDSKNLTLSIKQPILTNLTHDLSIGADISTRESQNYIDSIKYSLSLGEVDGYTKNNVTRYNLSYSYRDVNQGFSARLTHSIGNHNHNIDSRLPQSIKNILPKNDYTINLAEFYYTRRLTDKGASIVLRTSTQQTDDILIGMEKAGAVGISSTRGYIQNSYAFDKVNSFSLEFPYPLFSNASYGLSITPFYDLSQGDNNTTNIDSNNSLEFSSVGLAVNANYEQLSINMSYANALKNKELIKEGYLQSDGLQFQLKYDF